MRLGSSLGKVAVACALLTTFATATAASQYRIHLTAEHTNGTPTGAPSTQFDCSDTVYAVVQASAVEHGKHLLEAVWTDPRDEQREHTRYPFQVRQELTVMWVWLRLHRPGHAAITGMFNPSSGMNEFIGEWSVKFYIDGKSVDKKQFDVLC